MSGRAGPIREQVLKLQHLGVKAALLGNDTVGNVDEMNDVQILYMNPECLFNGSILSSSYLHTPHSVNAA